MVIGGTSTAAVRDLDTRVSAMELAGPYSNCISIKTLGATGNGTSDDSRAFEDAVALGNASGTVAVFVPRGRYLVTRPIVLTNKRVLFVGEGSDDSVIVGNVLGFIFDRGVGSIAYNDGGFRDLQVKNTNTGADTGCIRLAYTSGTLLSHVLTNGIGGFVFGANAFSNTLIACSARGNGAAGSVGFDLGAHTYAVGLDAQGCTVGIRYTGNNNCVIHGGRAEVCDTGVSISGGGADVSGIYTEACPIGLAVGNLTGGNIRSCMIYMSPAGHPSGVANVGLSIVGQQRGVHIGGVQISGAVGQSNVRVDGSADGLTLDGIFAGAAGRKWDVRIPIQKFTVRNCQHLDLVGNDANAPNADLSPALAVESLGKVDHLRGNKPGKNVSGIAVPVAAGSTFVDVAFPVAIARLPTGISGVTEVAGGTLAAGTYHYRASFVTEQGESSDADTRTITTTGGSARVAFYNQAAGGTWRLRIYRGATADATDSWFWHPMYNSTAEFTDSGQAFDGAKSPPGLSMTAASGAEPDASYGVTVTPAWNTTHWVTNKATTGFRINFGTAPQADSAVDWFLMR